MLQRKEDGSKPPTLITMGYLVAVEMEEDGKTTPEQVAERLAEGVRFMEGVGQVDVDKLGKIEVIDESEADDTLIR